MSKKKYNNKFTKYIIIVPVVSLIFLSTVLISLVIGSQNHHLADDIKSIQTLFPNIKDSERLKIESLILQKNVDSKKYYEEQNKILIFITIFITLLVIFITIFLSKKISKGLRYTNIKLEDKINIQTRELQENLRFLNKLLNLMPIPIFIKDKDFKYIKCNDSFSKFIGLNKDEIIGKSVYELSPKELADTYHKKDQELLTKENQYYKSEVRNAETGLTRVVEFYKSSYLQKNKFDGIIGVIVDITEKELAHNSLKQKITDKTMQNLKQTKELEDEKLKNIKFTAIGQLAAGMTHEINTPLTYIKGNFELMRYDIESLPVSDTKERMIEDSEKINDGINRLSNIVESMREMSQKSKEIKEDANIYFTMVTALTLLYNRSKHISNIRLNGEIFESGFDKNKEKFLSCVQKQRVEQVWVIIINNALDELVKIENFDDRFIDIIISLSDDEKDIIVKIKDNAGGISKNIFNEIFEPFVSSKEEKGIGIGLNVAKNIIDEQNATMIAYNEKQSAVFEIRFNYEKCNK